MVILCNGTVKIGIISSRRVAGAFGGKFQKEGGTRVMTRMKGWRMEEDGWMEG